MLYFIEAAGFSALFYHLTGISKIFAIKIATAIFIIAIIFDPILYYFGFIWTANTFIESIFINGIVFIGAMLGVTGKCLKTHIQA